MVRRLIVVLLVGAFALTSMGQEGCETETGGGGKKAAEKRKRQREEANKPKPKPDKPKPVAAVPEPEPNCDPNYEGACLDPNSSDYDCQGGEGDGPDYTGPVTVVGTDVHDLDEGDGDPRACEPTE